MSDKLVPATPQSLSVVPDYITKNDRRGFEDTKQTDVLIPRLALAQALSPQVTDGDPNRIEGLKVGDLFNSVTGRIYGREVHVQLLRKMPLRAMEFRSIDDGGGVKGCSMLVEAAHAVSAKTGSARQRVSHRCIIQFLLQCDPLAFRRQPRRRWTPPRRVPPPGRR